MSRKHIVLIVFWAALIAVVAGFVAIVIRAVTEGQLTLLLTLPLALILGYALTRSGKKHRR
jgi:carbon starvation protein CstA